MRKQKQCLCKVIVCLTLLLSMLPITTVCAKADFNTNAYINIDESYVYDGGCCDYNASASSGKNVSQMDEYRSYDYVIDSYNVQINVNEDNTFDITENINVYFNQARHGIYREIPLVNTVYRTDGTVSKNRAKVSNVSVSEQCSKSKTSDMYCIQIGSENVTVTGEKEYTIKYTYDIGADPLKSADEFYFNIIGSGWTSPIGGITFTINMPKKFDVRKLGFSAGYGGIFGTDKVEYEVNGNTITGGYNGIISPLEGLTVRLELPEGYFTHRIDTLVLISIFLPIVLVLLSFISVVKNDCLTGIKHSSFKSPYPPQSVNSLEAAFWYKGRATSSDVTSLLFYLANKGYIAVASRKRGFKKIFKFEKLRDYDGINEYEKTFIDELFHNQNYANGYYDESVRIAVSSEELEYKFYKEVNKIKKKINSKENVDKVFDKKSRRAAGFVAVYILLAFIVTQIAPIRDIYGSVSTFIPELVTYGFPLFVIAAILIKINLFDFSSIRQNLFICGICYVFSLFLVLKPLRENSMYMYAYVLGAVCCVLMIFLRGKLNLKRSEVGKIVYEHIDAFANFIKDASYEEVAEVMRQNPYYYSDICAYAFALYLPRKFSKGFNGVRMNKPDWIIDAASYDTSYTMSYDSDCDFDYLNSMLENINTETHRSLVSTPSPSGGGSGGGGDFGGGGGFSGGGSGGGGGGSW